MQFDMQRLIAAVALAATALFLVSQRLSGRRRRAAMVAAIAVYGALLAGVVVYAGLWLAGVAGTR
jgi:hypothetical protein